MKRTAYSFVNNPSQGAAMKTLFLSVFLTTTCIHLDTFAVETTELVPIQAVSTSAEPPMSEADQFQMTVARGLAEVVRSRSHAERLRHTLAVVEAAERMAERDPQEARRLTFQATAIFMDAYVKEAMLPQRPEAEPRNAVKALAHIRELRRAIEELFFVLDVQPYHPLAIMRPMLDADDPVRQQIVVELADIGNAFELHPSGVVRSRFGRAALELLMRETSE